MYFRRSGPTVEVNAPAKLNLFLEVLARRDDGFHEIVTLMTAVDIFDTLRFAPNTDGAIRLTCHWAGGLRALCHRPASEPSRRPTPRNDDPNTNDLGDLPEGTDNIVARAVQQLRRRAGVEHGASIFLLKRIPSAAGLGGASSDAAAALAAANEAWNIRWSHEKLADVAAELGSDIPFFFAEGAAVCRGRGETIERIEGLPRLNFVIVRPPAGLSTAEVYKACRVAERPADVKELLNALRAGNLTAAGRCFVNRLQETATRLSPWIARVQQEFDRMDLPGHQMSGSGTSYFGICRSARHARRIAGRLSAAKIGQVFRATSIAAPHRRP